MTKKLRKIAEEKGFMDLPLTNLYTQPQSLRATFSKPVPDVADAVLWFMNVSRYRCAHESSGGPRHNIQYYLAPDARLYVEVTDSVSGFDARELANHVNEIRIFSDDINVVRLLAQIINIIYEDGVLRNIRWKKIESEYLVLKEDGIETWKNLTMTGEEIRKQAEEMGLTSLPKITLYARAGAVRSVSFNYIPDLVNLLFNYFKSIEPTFVLCRSGSRTRCTYHYGAAQNRLYVEMTDQLKGINFGNPVNHAIELKIFSEKGEHIRNIAHEINKIFKNGILNNMNWKKIENSYYVPRKECIADWEMLL